jgi:hypothetical protein
MRFDTEITLTGPYRTPAQMLAEQDHGGGRLSIHDKGMAEKVGLTDAPIEAPTHFSQFDPIGVQLWGPAWFEQGCISSHFRNMVFEGEQVQASATPTSPTFARIEAHKADGTPVLVGTMSVGPDHGSTYLAERLAAMGDPGDLFIIDQLEIGMRRTGETAAVPADESNGPLYPFSLAEKLATITEPHPWYTEAGAGSSPWGRAVVPMEMISVLANKSLTRWPIRQPSSGLFLDLEVRMVDGPIFVGQEYRLEREVVGLSQSRRTESQWVRTTVLDADSDRTVAEVLLHSGVFKVSYPGYPQDRL